MRVLVTGVGGELGTRVARLLEDHAGVTELAGIDVDPPRRRLRRTDFLRVDPVDRAAFTAAVAAVAPAVVVHLGVYEPSARAEPGLAAARTAVGTAATMAGATGAGGLRRVVLRSGVEVYGRGRGEPVAPHEGVPPRPTSRFGRSLRRAELVVDDAASRAGATVATLRFAPIVGPHFPSPLGRLLRLPAVPFAALADPPFAVVHQEDAARAIVAAALGDVAGVVNVAGAGAVTASQAARLGSRVPVPVLGPGWRVAGAVAELAGAPVPDHVRELLTRGRCVATARAASLAGVAPERSTPDVLRALYDWAPVTPIDVATGSAA